MRAKQSEAPARGAKSNPRAIKTESRTGSSFQPLVGEPWPELSEDDLHWPDEGNSVSLHYRSRKDRTGITRSFTVALKLKTHVFVICLLMIVAGYAAYRGDGTLIRYIVKAVAPHYAYESPP